jgi:hypothetical protein
MIGPRYQAYKTTDTFTVLMNRLLNGLADLPEDVIGHIVKKLKTAIYFARARLAIMADPRQRLRIRALLLESDIIRQTYGFDFNP